MAPSRGMTFRAGPQTLAVSPTRRSLGKVCLGRNNPLPRSGRNFRIYSRNRSGAAGVGGFDGVGRQFCEIRSGFAGSRLGNRDRFGRMRLVYQVFT